MCPKGSISGPRNFGGHGFGTHNMEGERILEFTIANDVHIGNTWFKKRDTHLITYRSGGGSTYINYIHYNKSFNSEVRNVKVIPTEECVKQHYMLVYDFLVYIPHVKKSSHLSSEPGSLGTQLLLTSSSWSLT